MERWRDGEPERERGREGREGREGERESFIPYFTPGMATTAKVWARLKQGARNPTWLSPVGGRALRPSGPGPHLLLPRMRKREAGSEMQSVRYSNQHFEMGWQHRKQRLHVLFHNTSLAQQACSASRSGAQLSPTQKRYKINRDNLSYSRHCFSRKQH